MKTFALLLTLLMLVFAPVTAAPVQPQAAPSAVDVANYQMDVTLDAASHQLRGTQTITYTNQSDTPISDLVFHLYLNAFRDENSLFMREGGQAQRGYAYSPEDAGWIEVESLRVTGGPDLTLEPLEDGTLARASLPRPVVPGETLSLETSFNAQLPRVFARTGWALDVAGQPFFMVGQWFPKLGVWQGADGWNAHPYHVNSEFFADFGQYDVTLHLPPGYQVAATGMPTASTDADSFRFTADSVVDFAFSASPSTLSATRVVSLPAGDVELLYQYLPEHAWTVERTLAAAQMAMEDYSRWFGPYPYPRLTIVDVPDDGPGAGGMEYPTLVAAGTITPIGALNFVPESLDRSLEVVLVHEIGHQWWMGMVAFNEAEEPWLDEGLTDYASVRLMESRFGPGRSVINAFGLQAGYLDMRRLEYVANPAVTMYGPAWSFTQLDYGVAAYSKPTLSLLTLQGVLGEETMQRVLSTFFMRYRFTHPTTEDFRQTAEEVTGQNLDWFFDGLVYGRETLNYHVDAINGRTLTVSRDGQLAVPTKIELTFEDGSQRVIDWDGRESPKIFSFPNDAPLQSAAIDPQHTLAIDLIWSDNALSVATAGSAWTKLINALLFHLQDILLIFGGL